MKRVISIFLATLMLISVSAILISCSETSKETETEKTYYTVTFYIKGTVGYTKKGEMKVEEGSVIGDVKYDDSSYAMKKSWYSDKAGKNVWDLYKDEVRCDLKLYLQ